MPQANAVEDRAGIASKLPRPRLTGASLTVLVIVTSGLSLFAARNDAHADCATGDGNVTSPGVCTTPQNLTGQTGTVVSGATLATPPNATAYTISSNNSTVTNSGTVSSRAAPAFQSNSAGPTLINNGTITSTPETAAIVVSTNQSLNIVNTGNILGSSFQSTAFATSGGAIRYFTSFIPTGPISTITQAGGTIQGDILPNLTVNITGGTINGAIRGSSTALGNAGSGGELDGIVNFNLGGGTFTTGGLISVGSVNVNSGTLVLANDLTVNRFTNNAVLQISGTRSLSVVDFVQSSTGTLAMRVTPTDASHLKVAPGSASGSIRSVRLGGTLALSYAPGTYQARSYTLISADGRVSGTFSTGTGTVPTLGISQAITYAPQEVDLVLSGIAGPTNVTIFPAMTNALLLNGQRINGILLDRLGSRYAGIADGPFALGAASAAPVKTAQAGNIGTLVGIGSALPEALASEGAWFRGIGGFASVNGSNSAPGFNGKSGGFLAGFDRPVMPGFSLGLAAGYQHSDVDEHLASGTVESGRVAAYGGGWSGPNLLTATAGYGYDRISTARSLTGAGTATEGHDGHEFSLAGQWSLPTPMPGISGPAVVTPKLGIQYLHLFQTGFKETGADGSNLSSSGNDADSLQPYLGIAAAEKFITAEGSEIIPELRLTYSHEVLNNNNLLAVAAIDGTNFVARGVKPSRDMLTAGLGVTMRAQENLLLYANYDANLPTGNTSNQTVSAGLRIRF